MIIGITGKKRSGKDTAAEYLCFRYGFKRYGLADPMKKALKEIFLLSDDQLYGDLKEAHDVRYNTSARKLLQVFGTELFQYDIYNHIPEMMKAVKPRNIWINRFRLWYDYERGGIPIHLINELNNKIMVVDTPMDVVISDVRFPHEVIVIREMGGIIIQIKRNSVDFSDSHVSEMEMDKIEPDYIVSNNGSFKKLERKLNLIIEEIKRDEKNL